MHEARRQLKKVRSVFKLVRPAIGRRKRRLIAERLRELNRELAPARDAGVRLEVVRRLRRSSEDRLSREMAGVEASLRRELQRALNGLRGVRHQTVGALRHLLDLWSELQVPSDEVDIGHRVRRLEKKARKAYRQAAIDETDESLHTWRKRAKDLVNVLAFLDTRPGFVKAVKALNQRLGAQHDLAMLGDWLRAPRQAERYRGRTRLLDTRLEAERPTDRSAAMRAGAKLFGKR